MSGFLNIVLAQVSARVGDIAHNAAIVRRVAEANPKADLIVFPELHLCGYPPEDLVLKPSFVTACRTALEALSSELSGAPAMLIGLPWAENSKTHNAVALLHKGKIAAVRFKHHLPNYGVFDEQRIFAAGPLPEPMIVKGVKIGVPICEDIWQSGTVAAHLKARGAELLVVPNGSPFTSDKQRQRIDIAKTRIAETSLPLLYLNRVGGQDELVFDGASFALCGTGDEVCQLAAFEDDIASLSWTKTETGWRCGNGSYAALPDDKASLYLACVMGLRDYVQANGFKHVLLGLSGGIDSALVAAMCADALGPEHVRAVMLPSPYTSKASLEDAEACAKMLGLTYETLPITQLFENSKITLSGYLAGETGALAQENLQSRLRGVLLMGISNATGAMLVTTGNKSEMAVGYATLYGDMNGGFNPLKDLYKTQVYKLAAWRNATVPKNSLCRVLNVIPARILAKTPSAELRANQNDQDSLPAYDALDAVLCRLIEEDASVADIIADGHDRTVVENVARLLRLSEFKRRQAPPGPKLTSRNFGRDRRYPISNGFVDCS